ncbi:unnamed protein product, partial [Mesorhabditis belari]|uniref:Uncharacterized protein n=1 Tax=Mesorhabditis belari TaxID=2138241 RepID=A0AAF3FC85_9BILA
MKVLLVLVVTFVATAAIRCQFNGGQAVTCTCGEFCLHSVHQGKRVAGCGCDLQNGILCKTEGWHIFKGNYYKCCRGDLCNWLPSHP